MQRVGEFEKVSFEQFYAAMKEEFYTYCGAPEGEFKTDVTEIYKNIALPARATAGSAGYDFKSPVSFTLQPNKTIKIPTGIRVRI